MLEVVTSMAIGLNKQIQEHARASNKWRHQVLADKAYSLFQSINQFLYNNELPDVVIGFNTRTGKSGEYYYEGDSVGLNYHFDIHPDVDDFELVIACLHNAVHAYIDIYKTKAQYMHSAEFVKELKSWGIVAERKSGKAIELEAEVLEETLTKIGMAYIIPEIVDWDAVDEILDNAPHTGETLKILSKENVTIPIKQSNKSSSGAKSIKWSCTCVPPVNIRSYVQLDVMCNTCLDNFTTSG